MTSIKKLQEEAAREKDPETRKRLQALIAQRITDRKDPLLKIHDALVGKPEQYMTEEEKIAKRKYDRKVGNQSWEFFLIFCIVIIVILLICTL